MQRFSRGDGQASVEFLTGTAVWLTCCNCGYTTRVLAVLASRVLKARPCCPQCASTAAPFLNATPTGAGIALTDEQRLALCETDDPALHAWLQRETKAPSWVEWMRAAQTEVASRFSRHAGVHSEAGAGRGMHKAAGTIRECGSLPVHP